MPQSISRSWIATSLLLTGACTYPPTQVTVRLDTDAPPSRELTVVVTARLPTSTGDTAVPHTFVRGGVLGRSALPGTLAIVPPENAARDSTVLVTVEAHLAAGSASEPALLFRRAARFAFTPRQPTFLPIFLAVACGARSTSCVQTPLDRCTVSAACEENGQTCGDRGTCVGVDVAPIPVASDFDANIVTDATMTDSAVADAHDANSEPVCTDADGDGFTSMACGGMDCDDTRFDSHPGALDLPDLAHADTNCDGIDGDPQAAVFVAPDGSDANSGTMAQPMLTIGAAISRARAMMRTQVLVHAGTYAASVNVPPGISLGGGFCAGWSMRDATTCTTRIAPASGTPMTVDGSDGSVIDGFDIAAVNALVNASSVGIVVRSSPRLTLSGLRISTGTGSAGIAGLDGLPGMPGAPGNRGQDAHMGTAPAVGGTGGSSPCDGTGGAGAAGVQRGIPGRPGGQGSTPAGGGVGGNGGIGGGLELRGGDGSSGVRGTIGVSGSGGMAFGGFGADDNYIPADGRAGIDGAPGGGGGSGGSGGGTRDVALTSTSGAGGGGGGGGCGGRAGGAGGGGNASIGIVVLDSNVIVRATTIATGNGGDGGTGGRGGSGGGGGLGGAGGNGLSTPLTGAGGTGGTGGLGGQGGASGGGGGGPSLGIVSVRGMVDVDVTTRMTIGAGGAGGAGPIAGMNGASMQVLTR